ncbi:MAG: carbohydrate-binding family 9-like protein [Acidobacteria bacterium]|nr:carbohydrate-binding family 9-like protein [Acidobacteriota bacterium]
MRYLLTTVLLAVPLLAQHQPPSYRAGRTLDPIVIDGKLTEFTWAALPRVGPFTNIRKADQADAAPTEATVAWDDQNLYVAFSATDNLPWGTMYKRDSHIWEQEVVEVFLDPDGDGKHYPELEVSPHNVLVDLLIAAPGSGLSKAIQWDIEGLRTAVTKHPYGWITEIAIPWSSLAGAGVERKPDVGHKWRLGLYRIERPGGASVGREISALQGKLKDAPQDEKKAIQAEIDKLGIGAQWLAWSPTRVQNGFHDPERFGIVEFVLKP